MPTPAERQALLFLALVLVVGGGARVAGARRFEADVRAAGGAAQGTGGAAGALARQLAAVDSAKAAPRVTGRAKRRPSSVGPQRPTLSRGGRRGPPDRQDPIDVNSASAQELERLPRVGPALARRIVEWREEHGPFESVEALRHVRGIGVTTAAQLAPMVTFSSGYRPFRSEARPSRRDGVPPMP